MASVPSLPRALVPRRVNSLDAEREQFERTQQNSVTKAINSEERPVKEKHVRNAIIGTYQEKSSHMFWSIVTTLPLQGNPIVCWKFCHTLHKLLREGYPQVIQESQKYRGLLIELGRYWGHLKEGYGKLIAVYTRLLIIKLDFHKRNPRFPGNLSLTAEQLETVGENDVNNLFQITVEMFDYMDEVLALQAAVFGSLDMSRSNSMTSAGQCRLAPLIPCIQDSSPLYDYSVKIMFRLHSALPADLLIGHRDRFYKEFKVLRHFYVSASTLQYFKYLIQVPNLPEEPPNFLRSSDLSSHVSPVVVLPPPAPDSPDSESVDNLVILDMSAPADALNINQRNGDMSPELLNERDRIIERLQREIEELRMEIQRMRIEYERIIDDLRRQMRSVDSHNAELQTSINCKNEEIEDWQRRLAESAVNAQAATKLDDAEKKAKSNEEKFFKMKEVYTKLRDEHISLLRLKADVEKQLVTTKKTAQTAESSRSELEERLNKAESDRSVIEEVMQKTSTESTQQLAAVTQTKENLERAKQILEERLQSLTSQNEALEATVSQLRERVTKLEIDRELGRKESQDAHSRLQGEHREKHFKILDNCVREAEQVITLTLDEFDNPAHAAVSSTPEYLLSLPVPIVGTVDKTCENFATFLQHPEDVEMLLRNVTMFAHLISNFISQGKATSNASLDIERGEKLSEACRVAGRNSLQWLESIRTKTLSANVPTRGTNVKTDIDTVCRMAEALLAAAVQKETERIGEMVEEELRQMDKCIEDAAQRIAALISKSQKADTGLKLEVNGKILDACTGLMQAIKILVQRAKDLQAEIVAQGRGSASVKEFYKRNHRWTEGLISAAKAVGFGARFLVDAADKVVSGNAKFEELMVASQEIAASTAQLVVASKVKADRTSGNLQRLSSASKGVSEATGNVVATAKGCAHMVDEADTLDFSKVSLHQAKKLEMESQVRVLELESDLQKERLRLSALRKKHYSLAGPSEGWEAEDMAK